MINNKREFDEVRLNVATFSQLETGITRCPPSNKIKVKLVMSDQNNQYFAKFFYFNDLNKCKQNILIEKALAIRDYKNYLSNIITLEDINESVYNFMKKYNKIKLSFTSSSDKQKAIEDVYNDYNKRLNNELSKIKFIIQEKFMVEKYKVNGKTFKKGDTKNIQLIPAKKNNHPFIGLMEYLTRYYSDNHGVITNMRNKVSDQTIDDKKKNMYIKYLGIIDKLGEDRLMALAKSKHGRSIGKILTNRIEYKSLNFRSNNTLSSPILDFNKTYGGKINAFITLGAQGIDNRDVIDFPVKYARKYHGEMKDYAKGFNTYYQIEFKNSRPNRIVLNIPKSAKVIINKENPIGVDVNVKNNLFATSDKNIIDFDRKEMGKYINFLKYLDCKKSHNGSKKINIHDQKHYNYWKIKILNMLRRKANELVKQVIIDGHDHIILEDLGSFARSFTKSDEFEGFKYSRLIALLHLQDLKNTIKSIANKHDIQVTFVQPHYTSQLCPMCGHISRDNRKSQESFCCVECGYTCNADFNSANNIRDRFSIDVLRRGLLRRTSLGEYESLRLDKFKISGVLHAYYSGRKNPIADEMNIIPF